MKQKIMQKSQLADLINAVKDEYDVYAPVETENCNLQFQKVANAEKIRIDYLNTKSPPKEIVFPRTEVLFEYEFITTEDGKREPKLIPPKIPDRNMAILAIRPCDARSFQYLDNFFDWGKFKDDLYKSKMEKLVLIGMGCNSPKQTCYCTSLGGHPFGKDNLDVFMVDLGETLMLEALTEKGEKFMGKLSFLKDASDADVNKAKELSDKAEKTITITIDFSKTKGILDDAFYNEVWDEIAETCLGCGSCTFLCPTCHCFDVIDENDYANNRGRRVRLWDSCQTTLFTLHTSGHNPRTKKKQRCRQRIEHKFCYYPKNYDLVGCVGCGRCIIACPVNNDTRKIIESINAIAKKKGAEVKVA
ncbi:MAG: 4Fe-4S dicluster domain-containing protein [Candidatus Hodarchaeota archaeon]